VKLLVIVRPFSFHGGVERATAGLLTALVDHGHDVHVLSPGATGAARGVTMHRLRLPPLPPIARVLAFAAAARIVVSRRSWDIVQSHERTLSQDIYRAGEGCHRAYLDSGAASGGRRGYHRVLLALERRVFERSRHIVAIAKSGKSEIERLYRVRSAPVSVVYNGVDLDHFHPRNRDRDRDRALAELGIPKDAWVVGFVGSGFERKGLATLVDAFARLEDRAARLIVIGKGDTARYRQTVERLDVGDRVAWLGPRPDIERWYAASDVIAHPALYEPFGNVHLEALASGVPVVTSTRAGGAEIIRDGIDGGVVEPRDPVALAAALGRLRGMSTRNLRDAARAAAEPHTYARQVTAFEAIYRGLSAATPDFP
jgi:UDP-glucose:(heptosyl)LPS alpha-1,3-glucosyltransferase